MQFSPVRGARSCVSRLIALACVLALGCVDASLPEDAGAPDAGLRLEDARANDDAAPHHMPRSFVPTEASRAYCGDRDDDAIEARITEMLTQLSLAEKIAMMSGSTGPGVDGTWALHGNERIGVYGLHMLDGPRGLSSFSNKRGTAFPVAMMRGATWDPELEERVGRAMAIELRSAGADVILAPTINLLRHPRWGRAQETYSEDTHHMGAIALGFVRGVQAEGVLASAKHYVANSIENTRHDVNVTLEERTLRELYLPHFRRVVVEGRVASVMTAYNQVNGLYCDLQADLVRDVLKGEWGFAGFVESDWLWGTHGDAEAVLAGLDIEMPFASHFRRLPARVRDGALSEHDLDDAVRRILRAQLCFGLDTTPRPAGTRIDEPLARETPEHLALAREVARRGLVLLRNEGHRVTGTPVLPLVGVRSIAVLGRNADAENIGDEGSSAVTPTEVVTALEGLRARVETGTTVTHIPGTTLSAAQEAVVRESDVVIVVTGLQADDEGEATIGAGDRDSLSLPADELALLHAVAAIHPAVIVVLEGGAAIVTSDFEDEVQGLVFAFYPGARGGEALADVLFGDEAPSGRLPFSIPFAEADLPAFDAVSLEVSYGYLHGYRHLQHEGNAAAHAFGSGLTYTTFTYSDLTLSRASVAAGESVEVSVQVTNTGARRARETVQLYVAAIGSAVTRAPHDLRAFGQIELDPAQRGTVTLTLDSDDLAFWNTDTQSFEVEAIDYELRVGRASDEILTAATLSVR